MTVSRPVGGIRLAVGVWRGVILSLLLSGEILPNGLAAKIESAEIVGMKVGTDPAIPLCLGWPLASRAPR